MPPPLVTSKILLLDIGTIKLINDLEKPIAKQSYFGKDGLYFCGFYISPKGMLREIGIEAAQIAKSIVSTYSKMTGVGNA